MQHKERKGRVKDPPSSRSVKAEMEKQACSRGSKTEKEEREKKKFGECLQRELDFETSRRL